MPVTRCKHGNAIDDTSANPSCARCETEDDWEDVRVPVDPQSLDCIERGVAAFGAKVWGPPKAPTPARPDGLALPKPEDFTPFENCPGSIYPLVSDGATGDPSRPIGMSDGTQIKAWDALTDQERAALVLVERDILDLRGFDPFKLHITYDGMRIDTLSENRDPDTSERMSGARMAAHLSLLAALVPFEMAQRVVALGTEADGIVRRARGVTAPVPGRFDESQATAYERGYQAGLRRDSERRASRSSPGVRTTRSQDRKGPGVFYVDLPVDAEPSHSMNFSVKAGGAGEDVVVTATRCDGGSGMVTTAWVMRLHLKGAKQAVGLGPCPRLPEPPRESQRWGVWCVSPLQPEGVWYHVGAGANVFTCTIESDAHYRVNELRKLFPDTRYEVRTYSLEFVGVRT